MEGKHVKGAIKQIAIKDINAEKKMISDEMKKSERENLTNWIATGESKMKDQMDEDLEKRIDSVLSQRYNSKKNNWTILLSSKSNKEEKQTYQKVTCKYLLLHVQ